MSRFTFLRVEVDSAIVERVLGVTPGVEVVEGFDAEDEPSADEPEAVTATAKSSDEPDDDGLLGRAKPDSELLAEGSPVREYGLLAAGVSFVLLGVATVGIWVYRRRSDGPDETVDPEFGATETGPSEFDADSRLGGDRGEPPLSIVRDEADTDEAAEAGESETVSEPAGRTDDREDVEWTTKWETEPRPGTDESEDADVSEPDEDESHTSESIDVAPLLGIAFVAVTGAVVRWVRGSDGQ